MKYCVDVLAVSADNHVCNHWDGLILWFLLYRYIQYKSEIEIVRN